MSCKINKKSHSNVPLACIDLIYFFFIKNLLFIQGVESSSAEDIKKLLGYNIRTLWINCHAVLFSINATNSNFTPSLIPLPSPQPPSSPANSENHTHSTTHTPTHSHSHNNLNINNNTTNSANSLSNNNHSNNISSHNSSTSSPLNLAPANLPLSNSTPSPISPRTPTQHTQNVPLSFSAPISPIPYTITTLTSSQRSPDISLGASTISSGSGSFYGSIGEIDLSIHTKMTSFLLTFWNGLLTENPWLKESIALTCGLVHWRTMPLMAESLLKWYLVC